MAEEEIIEKIRSFSNWHYEFHLKGGLTTPIFDKQYINRHNQRKKYFFDVLDFSGKRVLDLGCNAGWWSLSAVEKGCDFVLGIDGRKMHVEQANLVFKIDGVERTRYEFVEGNVLDFDFIRYGTFDIVLCLGLLHHIHHPMAFFEKVSEANSDILVIDTNLSRAPGPYLEMRYDKLDDPRCAIDRELVLCHTKQSLAGMVREFGYSVLMLKPKFDNWERCKDYKRGARRAFICTKKSSLSSLDTEAIDRINVKDTLFWAAHQLRRRLR